MHKHDTIAFLLLILFVFLQIGSVYISAIDDNFKHQTILMEIEVEDKVEEEVKEAKLLFAVNFHFNFAISLMPEFRNYCFNIYSKTFLKLPDIPPEFN